MLLDIVLRLTIISKYLSLNFLLMQVYVFLKCYPKKLIYKIIIVEKFSKIKNKELIYS